MKKLHLSPDLSLPLEAVTETFGLLAVRGSGKTNAARVMAEEMFAAELPFVAVDPVGSWWGLRSGRDGKGDGLPIPIFGGRHGDVPLERGGGQLLADLVVDQRLSCVLDLSTFDSEASKKQFLLDFARRLYLRNEQPLHLFLEEADDYIPQRPMRDEAQLLRAWENIVRRGRARGLGITLITQRSASINKSVLTQVQTLIALRTTGPQDRAAVEDWLKYHAQSKEILASLAMLKSGEAWVWSPTFLGKTLRMRFRLSRTLDSGETPKLGKGKAVATLADVDLGDVKKRMAATIEKAKAEDPKELRKQLAEAQRRIAEIERAKPEARVERVEVPMLGPDGLKAIVGVSNMLGEFREELRALGKRVEEVSSVWTKTTENAVHGELIRQARLDGRLPPATAPRAPAPTMPKPSPSMPTNGAPKRHDGAGADLGAGERAILIAAAERPGGGVGRDQLSVLTGYKRSSRDTYIQRLRAAGYLEQRGTELFATDAGIAALGGDWQPLPRGHELQRHWFERLPEGERKVLEVLVAGYPKAVERERIDEQTGYKRSSRDTYLQRLGARRLVELVGRGEVRASAELFD